MAPDKLPNGTLSAALGNEDANEGAEVGWLTRGHPTASELRSGDVENVEARALGSSVGWVFQPTAIPFSGTDEVKDDERCRCS